MADDNFTFGVLYKRGDNEATPLLSGVPRSDALEYVDASIVNGGLTGERYVQTALHTYILYDSFGGVKARCQIVRD